jgi:hypothetical protein
MRKATGRFAALLLFHGLFLHLMNLMKYMMALILWRIVLAFIDTYLT